MNPHFKTIATALLLSGAALLAARAETYTYPQLVKRITDLEHLAEVPPAGEKTALASSYDRQSQYDAPNDKYLGWSANGDGQGIIRKEGDLSVLAEIKGPGCIWRTWSATAQGGHVKIYLDGEEKPVVDLPFIGYFDRKTEPFNRPNLVYQTAANGYDNFTPIPFQKSCKIVAEPGWGNYYHFNYTQFPEGTVVPTFKLPLSAEDTAALDQANALLGKCGEDPAGARPNQKTEKKSVTLDPGKSAVIADLNGPQAITALKCTVDGVPNDIDEQTTFFRQLAVSIAWDKQVTASVWSPLGDFFADAAGPAPYLSLPMGLTKEGQFYSYWYMPFASHATVSVSNDGDKPVTMAWEVSYAPLTKPIASLLRFHVKWHRDAFLPTREDRAIDWTLLTTQGKGRYVGTQLHIWNPKGGWWGEGDEKFFVDGEKFPSTLGTGSEDYFGYAWSSGSTFNEPLHGQPVNQSNHGHVSVHRWHIADDIPFQESFEGDIEKYFPNKKPTLYAAVAYWYLSPDGKDPYLPQPVADRIGYWVRNPEHLEAGAIEAEALPVLSQQPDSSAGAQDMNGFETGKWSGDSQLWWKAMKEGDKLELGFTVPAAGKYQVLLHLTRARDYGTFQAAIDGTKAGAPIDLYNAEVMPFGPVDLGAIDLTAGKHVLSFEVTGKNDASAAHLFGLDYIKLNPIK